MKAFYAKKLETLTTVAILLCLPCSANSSSPGGLDWLQKHRTSIRPPTWRHWFWFHCSHSSQISAFTYSSQNPFFLYVNPSFLTSVIFLLSEGCLWTFRTRQNFGQQICFIFVCKCFSPWLFNDTFAEYNKYFYAPTVLGTFLNTGNTAMNRANKNSCLCGTYILVNAINKVVC